MDSHVQPSVDRLLLVHHVAQRLKVGRRTVRWWAMTGRLPAHRQGVKVWVFAETAVNRFNEGRRRRNPKPS